MVNKDFHYYKVRMQCNELWTRRAGKHETARVTHFIYYGLGGAVI